MEHPYTELAPVYELFYIPRLSRAYYGSAGTVCAEETVSLSLSKK